MLRNHAAADRRLEEPVKLIPVCAPAHLCEIVCAPTGAFVSHSVVPVKIDKRTPFHALDRNSGIRPDLAKGPQRILELKTEISSQGLLPQSNHDNSPAPRPLRIIAQSWKEIASELDRGVRTVQRWERTLGLPVHRLGKGARCPVFAFKDELHFWFQEKAWASDLGGTPGESPADSRSTQSVSACSGDSRANRPPGKKRTLSGPNPKSVASILQSISDFFALEGSRQKQQNCQCCHSALRFLEGNFSLYGTGLEWKIPIPYCPNCNGEIVRESCQFATIH
jgi:hypothetical protein